MEIISQHASVFSASLTTNVPVVTDTIKSEETVPQQACFVAGTPVLVEDGFKLVEDVKVGDVFGCKSDGALRGQLYWRVVERVFRHGPTPILGVEIERRLIRGTANHLYYVEGRGWIKAAELQVGDQVIGYDGRLHAVTAIVDNGEIEPVYNFAVAEHHTYFVASHDGAVSALVHNDYIEQYSLSNGKIILLYHAGNAVITIGTLNPATGEVIRSGANGVTWSTSQDKVEDEVNSWGATDWNAWFANAANATRSAPPPPIGAQQSSGLTAGSLVRNDAEFDQATNAAIAARAPIVNELKQDVNGKLQDAQTAIDAGITIALIAIPGPEDVIVAAGAKLGYDVVSVGGKWVLKYGGKILSGADEAAAAARIAKAAGSAALDLGKFVGKAAITSPNLPAGTYTALIVDGQVYVARFHLIAWELAGKKGVEQFYGFAEIDAAGNIVKLFK